MPQIYNATIHSREVSAVNQPDEIPAVTMAGTRFVKDMRRARADVRRHGVTFEEA